MIGVKNLVTHAGAFALNVSLDIGEEYFVLLGMTGSGKTVFLECLCGLRNCESGTIVINGVDITAAEPRDRHIGYVPQDGALFSHLTVERNIEFGLTVNKTPTSGRQDTIVSMAHLLGIDHLLKRKIAGLSGGERQRVALARALVLKPSVLVLDEPVSALDEYTRETVCRELVRIQRELGIPVIHVCHSFEEASLIADRVGVMENGSIAQTGTIDEVRQSPANVYVAKIFRHNNLFKGEANACGIRLGDRVIQKPGASGTVDFLVRPWQISMRNGHDAGGSVNLVRGKVTEVRSIGPALCVSIAGSMPLSFFISISDLHKQGTLLAIGNDLEVAFEAEAVHVFGNSD